MNNNKQTGRKAASTAGRLLGNKSTPTRVKTVAASSLAQAPLRRSKTSGRRKGA